MDQNLKFFLLLIFIVGSFSFYHLNHQDGRNPSSSTLEKKVIYTYSSDKELRNEDKVDINTASLKELLEVGISSRFAEMILDYRNFVGRIDKMEDLERIKGIGRKTVAKFKKNLKVEKNSGPSLKKFNINEISEKEMSYLGFTKKEIKKITTFRKEKGGIYSNIEMMDLLTSKRYKKFEEQLRY